MRRWIAGTTLVVAAAKSLADMSSYLESFRAFRAQLERIDGMAQIFRLLDGMPGWAYALMGVYLLAYVVFGADKKESGLAAIRYAGHGSKQFFVDGKPHWFLFQARFINRSQQETAGVSALMDFWGTRTAIRRVFGRWAIGRPESDSPEDSGFQTHDSETVIPPGDIPARLNLAIRPEGQKQPLIFGRVMTAADVLDEGSILIYVRLAGRNVSEGYWLLMKNVGQADRQRALTKLWAPHAWFIWARMTVSRRSSKRASVEVAAPTLVLATDVGGTPPAGPSDFSVVVRVPAMRAQKGQVKMDIWVLNRSRSDPRATPKTVN